MLKKIFERAMQNPYSPWQGTDKAFETIIRHGRFITKTISNKESRTRETRLALQRLYKLKRHDISFISNNCLGGVIAKDLGLRHNSPTVNMFMFTPDYLKFLTNLSKFISSDMVKSSGSRYGDFSYPVGIVHDIEVHFPHSTDFEDAKIKWQRRSLRVEGNRLFIIGSDRDLCTPGLIHAFDALPFPNKLFFSSKPYPTLKSVVYFPEYANLPELPDIIPIRQWLKHINIVKWLNNGI